MDLHPGIGRISLFYELSCGSSAVRFPELKERYELAHCDQWEPALIREITLDLNGLEAQLPSGPQSSEKQAVRIPAFRKRRS